MRSSLTHLSFIPTILIALGVLKEAVALGHGLYSKRCSASALLLFLTGPQEGTCYSSFLLFSIFSPVDKVMYFAKQSEEVVVQRNMQATPSAGTSRLAFQPRLKALLLLGATLF